MVQARAFNRSTQPAEGVILIQGVDIGCLVINAALDLIHEHLLNRFEMEFVVEVLVRHMILPRTLIESEFHIHPTNPSVVTTF